MRPILLALAVTYAALPLRSQERPSDTLLTVGRYLDYETVADPQPSSDGSQVISCPEYRGSGRCPSNRGSVTSGTVGPGVADMSAASGILCTLEEQGFGLVAMTTQGASGIRRFVLGSVADKVIRGAAKPVMVVRPAGSLKK